jgi:hypothetical protein
MVETRIVERGGATEITSISFVGGLAYRFGETWTVSVRVPFSWASITGPQEGPGDDYAAAQIGNVELTVRPSFRLTRLHVPFLAENVHEMRGLIGS